MLEDWKKKGLFRNLLYYWFSYPEMRRVYREVDIPVEDKAIAAGYTEDGDC